MIESLLDAFKATFDLNQVKDIDEGMMIPLNRWFSFEQSNLPFSIQLNKWIYWVNPKVAKYALHFGINRNKKFVRYIKKPEKNEKFDFLKALLQNFYKWTDAELQENWKVVEMLIKDKSYCEQLDAMFGFDKNQCKVLGLTPKKYIGRPTKLNMNKEKTLEAWM